MPLTPRFLKLLGSNQSSVVEEGLGRWSLPQMSFCDKCVSSMQDSSKTV